MSQTVIISRLVLLAVVSIRADMSGMSHESRARFVVDGESVVHAESRFCRFCFFLFSEHKYNTVAQTLFDNSVLFLFVDTYVDYVLYTWVGAIP